MDPALLRSPNCASFTVRSSSRGVCRSMQGEPSFAFSSLLCPASTGKVMVPRLLCIRKLSSIRTQILLGDTQIPGAERRPHMPILSLCPDSL